MIRRKGLDVFEYSLSTAYMSGTVLNVYTYFILTIWDKNYCHFIWQWLWFAHKILIYPSTLSSLLFSRFWPWIWVKNMYATSCTNGTLLSSLSFLCHLKGYTFQMISVTRWRKVFSPTLCVMWARNKLLLCLISKIRGVICCHSIGYSEGHQTIASGSKMTFAICFCK